MCRTSEPSSASPAIALVVAGELPLLVGEDFAVQLGRSRLDVVVVGPELPEHTQKQ